jgi:hypothetical protein
MKTITKIALIAFLWIIVINPGRISVDTAARLDMAHALWKGTDEISLSQNDHPLTRLDSSVGVLGVGGKRYHPYDMGQPLLMLPGDWLGTQLHQLFPQLSLIFARRLAVNLLIFVPLNVAVVVSCFWLLRLFDFPERVAGIASLVWLLGTTVLHYAQINQQNNQVLLFTTLGYATAIASVRYRQHRFVMLSGLALGAAVLVRLTSAIHALTVLLFLLGCLAYQKRDKLQILQAVGVWIAGFLPLVLLGRVFDYLRFGTFWTTGASLGIKQLYTDPIFTGLPELPANYPLINPPQVGILGVLFSPAKSIFIYDPLLLPCLILGIVAWKKLSPYIQGYLITAMLNLSLFIALTSRLDFWHGDVAWGARYHVTSVHLLLIPLIPLFIQEIMGRKGLIRGILGGIVGLVIMVQVASVILYPTADSGKIFLATSQTSAQFRLGRRITNIGCLVNASFSEQCSSLLAANKQSSLHQKIALLPFNFTQSRGLVALIWGLLLTGAMVSTLRFCLVG